MKLKSWVKVGMLFIFGVFVVSKIFSITSSSADSEIKVVYGIISLNVNGESHVKPINSANQSKLIVDKGKNYEPLEMITVIMKGDKVINHYLSTMEESEQVNEQYKYTVREYRDKIYEAIFE